ncbi:hypothetical protein ACQUY5_26240 [Bacillus cereus]|uniref:hypothetical protein n=1 Tax=Bacillus cereus TaxID=1396 RepID=UPI003D172D2E
MSTQPKPSQIDKNSLYNLVWTKITRGVTEKLNSNESFLIDKWSPNNLRRLIISPEGVLFQLFVTEGTFHKKKIDVIPFPINEVSNKALQEGYAISSVLHRNRVFSSVEEVIIIPRSPNVPYYSLSPKEVETLHTKSSSLKRLANVIIVTKPVSLRDFIEQNIEALADPYSLLKENPKSKLGNPKIVNYVKDWYKHTSLRPQYYSLDKEDARLYKYFKDVREKCSNKPSKPLSIQNKPIEEEKVEETEKDVPIEKLTEFLMLSRGIQLGFANKDNPRLQILKPYLSVVRHQPNEKFRINTESKYAKRLDSMGYYSETGSVKYRKLDDILFVDTVLTARKTSKTLSEKYPIWGSYLTKINQSLMPPNGQVTQEKAEKLYKMVMFKYRKELDLEVVLSNVEVTEQQVELLNRGIDLPPHEREDLENLILFDTGLVRGVQGVDLLLLHDLYIYCNNIPHRPYNSVLKHKDSEIVGYVTNQGIAERIALILDEVEDSSTESEDFDTIEEEVEESVEEEPQTGPEEEDDTESEVDPQWELCKQIVSEINEVQHKVVWRNFESELKVALRFFISSTKDNYKQEVSSFVIRLINQYQFGGVSKSGTMAHSINQLEKRGTIVKLGCKGYKPDRFASRVLDVNKEVDEEYSKYFLLLKELYQK